ncbi:MAG: sigma-70 family RNA polymerase sigma factor [Planctomycetota bacterium]
MQDLSLMSTDSLSGSAANAAGRLSWEHLDSHYRPLLRGFFLRHGLNEPDAEDLTQDVLWRCVCELRAGRHAPGSARLSRWLLVCARSRAIDHWRRRRPESLQDTSLTESGIRAADAEPENEELWRQLLASALGSLRRAGGLRTRTLRAFEEVMVRGRGVSEVAAELGVSRSAVHVSCHRAVRKLRGFVELARAAS